MGINLLEQLTHIRLYFLLYFKCQEFLCAKYFCAKCTFVLSFRLCQVFFYTKFSFEPNVVLYQVFLCANYMCVSSSLHFHHTCFLHDRMHQQGKTMTDWKPYCFNKAFTGPVFSLLKGYQLTYFSSAMIVTNILRL